MPKVIQYSQGSIIYFEEDKDERIFILQKGIIDLKSTDVETKSEIINQVKHGEFFGVKSALGRFPREETASVACDSVVVAMSVAEFEQMFSGNKQVILKMLRVFSGQLRQIHRKAESILSNNTTLNQAEGMLSVAKSFYDDEQYRACCDVCVKSLARFPDADNKENIAKLYADSKLRADRSKKNNAKEEAMQPKVQQGALKQFMLPAFSRFAKKI